MIYLDYNASTPVDPVVRDAMQPFLGNHYGNPSSSHVMGRTLSAAIDKARGQVAGMLGASAREIVFTSGGTESNNFVIKGVASSLRGKGRHIITSAIEHPAIVNPCRYLERLGCEVTYVGVDTTGRVDPDEVERAIRRDTILITIMLANNEVGTIQPIAEVAEIARRKGVLIHTDAAQACGKINTRVRELGVDFLSIAGHKLYAPQGIGALYIRDGVDIEPLHHGAGHESGRRAGTEPVPALVGLGAAAELVSQERDHSRVQSLRDGLHQRLVDGLGDGVVLIGHPQLRLPNTLAVGFCGRMGAEVLAACPDLCATTGSACHADRTEPSAVLKAMRVPDEVAFGAVRLSTGRYTTEDEIDQAAAMLVRAARG